MTPLSADDQTRLDQSLARARTLLADELVKGLMSQTDPTYLGTCQALVASGEVPAYGGFIDPHHTQLRMQCRKRIIGNLWARA